MEDYIKYNYRYLIIEISNGSYCFIKFNIISCLVSWESYLKLPVEQSSSSFHSSTRGLAHLSL